MDALPPVGGKIPVHPNAVVEAGGAPECAGAAPAVLVRHLGLAEYVPTWEAMQRFTAQRRPDTPDEFWVLQHPPVFTLGQSGKPEHILEESPIPVVKIDRGGQVTYHGPGQIVVYLMLDLHRRKLKVRELVARLEQAVINLLGSYGLVVNRREAAPGVYLGAAGDGAKIAALGLRVKNGCTYHGVSLNVDMDLSPFSLINPCGYPGLAVTQTRDQQLSLSPHEAGEALCRHLLHVLEHG